PPRSSPFPATTLFRSAPAAAQAAPARAAAPALPGPLAHVAWADAWLTRVAGAPTPTAGGAEAPTAVATAARALLSQGAPSQVFLAPPAPAPVPVPGLGAGLAPAPAPARAPSAVARPEAPSMPMVAPVE